MSTHGLDNLRIDAHVRSALVDDFERFSRELPRPLEDYVRERYRLDLTSEYGGIRVKNPFGKGSGQLSLNASQVGRDADEGLGFVVLKTIIAEDPEGGQSMAEWAIPETRMVVERIVGTDGTPGWTVTWKGRGWYDTFEKYLEFFGEALDIGARSDMLVVPSCKYHLLRPGEGAWRLGEYEHTTRRLLDVWESRRPGGPPMPIEKDFSPTLAGSDRAAQTGLILEWLLHVPGLMRRAAAPRAISVGLKLFNAMFDDAFQLEMLRAANEPRRGEDAPDFVVYANRLFDPDRQFEGVRGVAYGGPDLSARNLSVLGRLRELERAGEIAPFRRPLSATGDVSSGRCAAAYLARGASTFQLHTFFQLPASEYRMRGGRKTARALHELLFHPEEGFIAWLLHLRRTHDWPDEWNVKQMAAAAVAPASSASIGAAVETPLDGVEVRPFEEGDIPEAISLERHAGWNQTEGDWRRLLRLAPEGCFAATVQGRLVATTTTTRYESDLAWIGMVLVHPDHRRRGIATRLVRSAIDFLEGEGVATIMLDATPAGRPVYEALGFELEASIERWEGVGRVSHAAASDAVREASVAELDAAIVLDRRAFGADRSHLLRALVEDGVGAPLVALDARGDVQGYALVRRGANAHSIGPIVATSHDAATALLDAALSSLDGRRVYVDAHTRFGHLAELLSARGLRKQRDLIRMRRGPCASSPAAHGWVLAIAGPEVG